MAEATIFGCQVKLCDAFVPAEKGHLPYKCMRLATISIDSEDYCDLHIPEDKKVQVTQTVCAECTRLRQERDKWIERFKEADHLAAARKEFIEELVSTMLTLSNHDEDSLALLRRAAAE